MPQLCKPAVPSSAESTVMAKRISSVQNFLFFIVFSLFTFHFFTIDSIFYHGFQVFFLTTDFTDLHVFFCASSVISVISVISVWHRIIHGKSTRSFKAPAAHPRAWCRYPSPQPSLPRVAPSCGQCWLRSRSSPE